MTTFALIHGASSAGFYWDRVVPLLVDAGHTVVAPDLPAGDLDADFVAYADAVEAALEGGAGVVEDLVVVGQSMAGSPRRSSPADTPVRGSSWSPR